MNQFQIEKYFYEERLEELLQCFQKDFEIIDDYSKLLSGNSLDDQSSCHEALNILSGIYMRLNIVYHIAQYQYDKRCLEYFKARKEEIGNTMYGEKFKAIDIKREANIKFSVYMRIANIFHAYLTSSEKGILTLQSKLKFLKLELSL
jgi:hypothetical protein